MLTKAEYKQKPAYQTRKKEKKKKRKEKTGTKRNGTHGGWGVEEVSRVCVEMYLFGGSTLTRYIPVLGYSPL